MNHVLDTYIIIFITFFYRPIYSDSVNALQKYFNYGVDDVKMKEWFFTLAYPGVPLTDSVSNEFVS